MGFANLNVWISQGDPCSISLQDWSVLVTDCSGHPISWCEPTAGGPHFKHGCLNICPRRLKISSRNK